MTLAIRTTLNKITLSVLHFPLCTLELIVITFQKDIVPHDPLLPGNIAVIDSVEEFEDPVHQNVIRHVEDIV